MPSEDRLRRVSKLTAGSEDDFSVTVGCSICSSGSSLFIPDCSHSNRVELQSSLLRLITIYT